MIKKWWQDKTIYQIYPKSFCDSNGDGIGDIPGIISRLDYLKDLGVDILWLSPCYASPMVDQGYDISDYYKIDPMFGTLEDMDRLIAEAKDRGMYVIMDLVVNHCSSEHAWFKAACADPDGEYGKYFYIADKDGDKVPCNWRSYFGGSVWSPLPGHPEKVYYHTFHEKQPDLNWENPALRREIYRMINWWLDRGLAGFRIDAIISIKKVLPFRDFPADQADGLCSLNTMLLEAEGLMDLLQEMKQETFAPHDAFTVGEVAGEKEEDIPLFIGKNGCFSSMFDFRELSVGAGEHGWYDREETTAEKYIRAAYEAQELFNRYGFATNVIENHDNPRGASRFIPADEISDTSKKMLGAVYFFMHGIPCLYQGQELGMENYPFVSMEEMDDIAAKNEYKVAVAAGLSEKEAFKLAADFSRDNARTPMQWTAGKEAGFTDGTPWLPVNPDYTRINAEDEEKAADSVLSWYRQMLALRKSEPYRETFVYGNFRPVSREKKNLMAYIREGKKRILVAGNYQNVEEDLVLEAPVAKVLLNNLPQLEEKDGCIRLAPYQAVVLELQKEENLMYQVSTLQALMMGYSRSVITVEELKKHGTAGLGTFEDVNGEMIMVDGACYQASEDGDVTAMAPDAGVPFASVAQMHDSREFPLEEITDIEKLKEQLLLKVEEGFGLNSMHIAVVDGLFRQVSARSESAHRSQHVTLKDVLKKTQKEFFFDNIPGTLICIYYPDYLDGINAAGWHFHFLSKDRTKGGHVFDLNMERGTVRLYKISRMEMQLPVEPAFDTYSLRQASNEDIKSVEQGK